jgi:hypothetical protein
MRREPRSRFVIQDKASGQFRARVGKAFYTPDLRRARVYLLHSRAERESLPKFERVRKLDDQGNLYPYE